MRTPFRNAFHPDEIRSLLRYCELYGTHYVYSVYTSKWEQGRDQRRGDDHIEKTGMGSDQNEGGAIINLVTPIGLGW